MVDSNNRQVTQNFWNTHSGRGMQDEHDNSKHNIQQLTSSVAIADTGIFPLETKALQLRRRR